MTEGSGWTMLLSRFGTRLFAKGRRYSRQGFPRETEIGQEMMWCEGSVPIDQRRQTCGEIGAYVMGNTIVVSKIIVNRTQWSQ